MTTFLAQEDSVWGRVRAHWLLALAYVGAFIAVAYFLPDMLNTIAVVSTDSNGLPGTQTVGAGNLTTEWGFLRAATTLLVILGALVLMLPVAWIYTVTRPAQYDPSLVQSLVILPIVAAGIVIVVKDSLALAFGLAGIVAAVRFRNTLNDSKDAVYIFLALAVGVASGVGALDVALVLSASFNAVVLVLWRYNICNIYDGCYIPKIKHKSGHAAAVRVAEAAYEPAAAIPSEPAPTEGATAPRHSRRAGVLVIRVPKSDHEAARLTIEQLLDQRNVTWSRTGAPQEDDNQVTLQYAVSRPRGEKRKQLVRLIETASASHMIEARYIRQNGRVKADS
jgi:hypothetical protein